MEVFILKNVENGKEYVGYCHNTDRKTPMNKYKDDIYIEGLTEALNEDIFIKEIITEKETSLVKVENLVELHIQARRTLVPDGYNKDLGFKMVTG